MLGGLTSSTYGLAVDALKQAGLGSIVGETSAAGGSTKKQRTEQHGLAKEYRRAFASALQEVLGEDKVDALLSAKEAGPTEGWAKGLKSHDGVIQWTPEQYIARVGINGNLIEALLDTGGEKSMVDVSLAELLGLRYQRGRGSEFGKYITAGGHVQPYHGLVRGPVDVRFSENVTVPLRFIKVVEHGEPVLILGADLLRGGRPTY